MLAGALDAKRGIYRPLGSRTVTGSTTGEAGGGVNSVGQKTWGKGRKTAEVKQDPTKERRLYPRAPVRLDVEYRLSPSTEWVAGKATDLSGGGMALVSREELTAGGMIDGIRLTLPAEAKDPETALELRGQIVRCRPATDAEGEFVSGLCFLDLESQIFERIQKYAFVRIREAVEKGEFDEPAQRIPFAKPIAIRFELFKDFINEVSANLSTTGMFIQTSRPRPVDSVFDFKFEMGEDFTIIEGRGKVVWVRDEKKGSETAPGMGVRFERLDPASENVIRRMVEDQIRAGYTPFELEAEIAPDLPLGDDASATTVDEELTAVADLEEISTPPAGSANLDLVEQVDNETRSEQLEHELSTTAAEREQLSRRLRSTQDEKEALERELAALNTDAQHAQVGFEEQLVAMESALAAAGSTEKELRGRIADFEAQQALIAAPGQIGELTAQLDEFRRDAETALRRSQEEHAELEVELSTTRQEGQNLLARIAELEARSADESTESLQLRSRLGQLEKENERQRRELAAVVSQRETSAAECKDAQAEVERLRDEVSSLEDRGSRRRQELDERTTEQRALIERHDHAKEEIGELTSLIGELERFGLERQQELDGQISEHLDLIRQSEEASEQTRKLKQRVTDAEDEVDRRQEELETLRSEKGDLSEKADEALAEAVRLRARLGDRDREDEARLQELGITATEREAAVEKLLLAQEESGRLAEKIAELESTVETRGQELERIRAKNEALADEGEKANAETVELRRRLAELTSADQPERQDALSSAETDVAAAQRITELESELTAFREAATDRVEVDVGADWPVDSEPARKIRPLQIVAGLLIGAVALFAWQRAGLPTPGGSARERIAAPAGATDAESAVSGRDDTASLSGETQTAGLEPLGDVADPATEAAGVLDTAGAPQPDPRAIDGVVQAWAAAWSAQRVDDYLAHYAPDFTPPDGLDRATWESQRRDRVSRPAALEITLGPLTRERAAADRYRVNFRQGYESPTYADEVTKTLEMVWVDGAWMIASEVSV